MKLKAAVAGAMLLASTFAVTTANAGGMAPQMQPPVIIEDTTSNGGILVPILALIMFAAVM